MQCAKKKGYRIMKYNTKFIKNLVIQRGLDIRLLNVFMKTYTNITLYIIKAIPLA